VIACCTSAADVVAAVGFAREHQLEICVRGGAHNPAGTAVCDEGLMINLSLLNTVTVDPQARRALQPHALEGGNAYINAAAEFSSVEIRGSYGTAKYDRLARIKAEYDPGNVFHINANVQPA
jgi:FAD/FMN-containing dehydrogenase